MNGAQALINTLVDGGVDVCFANPGTSEMHFVAALDTVPRMRGVLALFSKVWLPAPPTAMPASPTGRAAVLLHLGPGLGNGLANLHNARRAESTDGGCGRRPAPLITRSTTPHWNPTSTRSPAPARVGGAAASTAPLSGPTRPRPSRRAVRARRSRR